MKQLYTRLRASRLGRLVRRLGAPDPKEPGRASIYEEMEQGAVIGFFASTLLALHLAANDLTSALLIIVSALGLFVGAVIGAVLWIGSAELPEDTVRAPAPGQARSKTARR